MSRIFISHSSANNAAALALGSWLEANGWSDYFLDIENDRGIVPGERWMAALAGAVDRCEAVIFLLSPAWRDSKYCFTEFFEAKKLGKRIFGVIVEPIPLAQLPEQMTAEWQVCDLTDTPITAPLTHGNASGTSQDQAKKPNPLEPAQIANRIVAASFSPDSTRVVTVSTDKTAQIWNADTGKLTAGPMIHEQGVSSALFSPDNRLVVTTSGDRAYVWSTDDGTQVGDPKVHDAEVVSANFSADGRRVVTAALGGTAWVWSIMPPGLNPLESVGGSGRMRAAFGSWKAFQSWWSGQIWVEGLCKNFLRGNIGVIREADIRAARLLPPSSVGEDLCEGVWAGGK